MIIVYGINNCDTVRKARQWLESRNIPYRFHDFRKHGVSRELLEKLEAELGWNALLNTRGTSWRSLDASRREHLDRGKALALMLEQPSLIKRPILETGAGILVGFAPDDYASAL